MKLHTYAGNVHALQSLIVARYNGVEIELAPVEMGKDNKTKAFLAKSPMGKVPVLETAEGCICEAGAIARYVARIRADTNMYGSSFFEAGLVDQWVEFAKRRQQGQNAPARSWAPMRPPTPLQSPACLLGVALWA